jgi:prolyl oligopeptidase PreP (S9A serine peptidase family)
MAPHLVGNAHHGCNRIALGGCQNPGSDPARERALQYPETRRVDAADIIHGTRVADPYRWLESLDSLEVREWSASQTRIARAAVADPALRTWLAGRITAHASAWEAFEASGPALLESDGPRLEAVGDGSRQRVVVVKSVGSRRVLADPGADRPGWSVTRLTTSPDGTHVIVESSAGGSEWVSTQIVRVEDGVALAEFLDGLLWEPPTWTRDSRGFFYVQYGRPRPGERSAFRGSSIRYHTLGTTQAADVEVWRTPREDTERTGSTRPGPEPPATLQGGPYEVSRVRYTARDDVPIPMFIVHRRNLALDGSHPVILHGYGASHTPTLPWFDEPILTWFEAGGVYAAPNLRGGGEFGREWWEAAILERKQTTFDDFIAAAEFLVEEGWTTPGRLAIHGMSYGGMLVSAVMTERPDLFGAAVAEVPATDLIRLDLGRHRAQLGSPADSDQFPFVLRHSPLHRVREGRCYPATFISTALNDERIPAWNAFKFTAALQWAQVCNRPVVLRVDDVGGHGGMTPAAWNEHWVDWLTFVAKALRVQPKVAAEQQHAADGAARRR